MAGVWEVVSISKSFVPLTEWETFLNRIGISCDVVEMSSIDDWKYTNETSYTSLSDPQMLVKNGKIVLMNMSGNGVETGMILQYHHDCYWANLWINTKGFPALDNDEVNAENSFYYRTGVELADGLLKKYACIAVLMGFELCIEEDTDISCLLSQSRNVTLGLLSKLHFQKEELLSYKWMENSDYFIYKKQSEVEAHSE